MIIVSVVFDSFSGFCESRGCSMVYHLRLRCIDYEGSTAEPISAPKKATRTQPRCSGTVPAASPVNGDGVGVLGLMVVLDAFLIPPTGLQSSYAKSVVTLCNGLVSSRLSAKRK